MSHSLQCVRLPCFDVAFLRSVLFLKTNILHGSVATRLRCDEIFSDLFIANFLLDMPVKEF